MTPAMSTPATPLPGSGSHGGSEGGSPLLTDRRGFLMIGGAGIALSALLVGCSRKDPELLETGSMPQAADVTTTTAPGSPEMDLTLLRTLQSIELLAVDTYTTLAASTLITNAAVKPAFETFKSHHSEHAELVAGWISKAGGTPVDKANEYLKTEVIDKAVEALADESGVLHLAVEIENIAAQSYTLAGGSMTTPSLRQTVMSIGPSEARHMSVIYGILETPQVPLPQMPTRNAAPKRALLP